MTESQLLYELFKKIIITRLIWSSCRQIGGWRNQITGSPQSVRGMISNGFHCISFHQVNQSIPDNPISSDCNATNQRESNFRIQLSILFLFHQLKSLTLIFFNIMCLRPFHTGSHLIFTKFQDDSYQYYLLCMCADYKLCLMERRLVIFFYPTI